MLKIIFCFVSIGGYLANADTCASSLRTTRLSPQQIRLAATWPLDATIISNLPHDQILRVLLKTLQNTSERKKKDFYKIFETALELAEQSRFSKIEILKLIKNAIKYKQFSSALQTININDFSSDEIWQVFEGVLSRHQFQNLEKIGLLDRLEREKRITLYAMTIRHAGWNAFIDSDQSANLSYNEKQKLFVAFVESKRELKPYVPQQICRYIASDQFVSAQRADLLRLMLWNANGKKWLQFVANNLTFFRMDLEDLRKVSQEILASSPNPSVITKIIESQSVSENVAITAIKQFFRNHYDLPAAKNFLRRGDKLFVESQHKLALLKTLLPLLQDKIFFDDILAAYKFDDSDLYKLLVDLAKIDLNLTLRFIRNSYPAFSKASQERLLLATQPLKQITKYSSPNGEPHTAQRLKELLLDYQHSHSFALSTTESQMPWDHVQKVETGLMLLQIQISELNQTYEHCDSLHIISKILFGFVDQKFIEIAKQFSSDSLGFLYELVLDIHVHGVNDVIFSKPLDYDLWKKSEFLKLAELIKVMRDWSLLNATSYFDELISTPIDPSNIESATARFKEKILENIKQKFDDKDLEFHYEELAVLQDQWSNVEPIYTLLARYWRNPEWSKEIKILSRIFKSSLSNKFLDYKYSGFTNDVVDQAAAKNQLAILTSQALLENWKSNPIRINKFGEDSSQTISADARLDIIKSIYETNLKVHAQLQNQVYSLSAQRFILDQLAHAEKIILDLWSGNSSEILNFSLSLLGQSQDLGEIERVASFVLGHSRFFNISPDIRSDLKSILSTVSDKSPITKLQFIITTTFDDPKTLLTIGDLVQTSSCQNYRTGGWIQTLPSYVIDANIKGIASFSVEPKHFESTQDLKMVMDAFSDHSSISVRYDGNLRRFHFEFKNGVVVTTKSIDHAYRRHILRLGMATQKGGMAVPALLLERSYRQSHSKMSAMAEQTESIISEIQSKLHATRSGHLKIVGSRNPNGTYTDMGGGIRKGGDYKIHVPH